MGRSLRPEDGDHFSFGISVWQAAAAASEHRSTRDLLGLVPTLALPSEAAEAERQTRAADQPRSPGSFEDIEMLVEQLAAVPEAIPADPPRAQRTPPRLRVGSNPAAHNGALLGDSAP